MADQDARTSTDVAEDLFSRLEESLGHLVRRTQQLHTVHWSEAVDGGLTAAQYAILTVISGFPGLRQPSVAEMASLDRSTSADVISRLERNSWISRQRDPADARRNLLLLTPPARVALSTITLQAQNAQERLLVALDDAQRSRLIELLARVAYADSPELLSLEPTSSDAPVLSLTSTLTHLLRRTEQRQQRLWSELVGKAATPTQYAVFCALREEILDQKSVGALASLDTSNAADVIGRLQSQSLLAVTRDEQDRRRRLVGLTPSARELLRDLTPRALSVHRALSSPLTAEETDELLQMLSTVSFAAER